MRTDLRRSPPATGETKEKFDNQLQKLEILESVLSTKSLSSRLWATYCWRFSAKAARVQNLKEYVLKHHTF